MRQFEAPGHGVLEEAVRIILFARGLQLVQAMLPVTLQDGLSLVPVIRETVASRLPPLRGHVVNLLYEVQDRGDDLVVVGGVGVHAVEKDDDEWAVIRRQTERVACPGRRLGQDTLGEGLEDEREHEAVDRVDRLERLEPELPRVEHDLHVETEACREIELARAVGAEC